MSGDGASPFRLTERLLLSVDMDEEHSARLGWAATGIVGIDLQTEKASRVTPLKLFGWEGGCWLDSDNVLF